MRALALAILSSVALVGCGADVAIIPQVYAENADFTYETFTEEKFETLRGTEEFAVFFHSASCGTCRGKDKEIISEVADFTDGTILKLEYSDAPEAIRTELGVKGYDTFTVFAADGSFETKKGMKVDDLKTKIQ